MGCVLILAEKPSVAKNIADALEIKKKQDGYFEGNGYLITWAYGHLLELYDAKDYDSKMSRWKMENFPFIPEQFKYKSKKSSSGGKRSGGSAAKQLKTIHYLMKRTDVDAIISACDYDREGQLIGDSIIYKAKTRKQVYRLLLNEWTEEAVLDGLQHLKPNTELRPLLDAGMSRQWADWVIGINLTSVATLKYQKGRGNVLNIGRVLLPTLKIIYDRDKEIADFVPEDYFKLAATFKTNQEQVYDGTYTVGKNDKFPKKEVLQDVQNRIADKKGIVTDKKVAKRKELPPLLFNLSNLQGYITNKYAGWTAGKVLKIAQALYEKKFITYPRTASMALEESLTGRAKKVLEILSDGMPYQDKIRFTKSKRVFNNAKVESHSAIIPTYKQPKRLSPDEKIVYETIKNRFIMQFMPAAVYEETTIATSVPDADLEGIFLSKGRVELEPGWKQVENWQTNDKLLPVVEKDEMVQLTKAEISKHTTKPPKPHTEKTLLKIMETCGKQYKEEDDAKMTENIMAGFSIGTAATRAETIAKLKTAGYITASGKNLSCTDVGRKMVEIFPVKNLFDLEFTGRLEKTLADIQKGNVPKKAFLDMIFQFTKEAVSQIKNDDEATIRKVDSPKKSISSSEVLGKCPNCGGNIMENSKGFGCSNWKKGCKFVIWKNDKYLAAMKKKPTKTMVKDILGKKQAYVKGLTSKQGKKFNAYLRYEKNPANDYYSWMMSFEK